MQINAAGINIPISVKLADIVVIPIPLSITVSSLDVKSMPKKVPISVPISDTMRNLTANWSLNLLVVKPCDLNIPISVFS